MSKNTLQLFLMLLKNGKWNRIIQDYYHLNTCVECVTEQELKDRNWLLKLFMSANKILQYKVADIEISGNQLSFTIHTVTKDIFNQIDLSEHKIRSTWKDNKINKHNHRITAH